MTVPWRWLDGDSRVIELSGGNQQKIDVTGQILEVDGGVAN
jgi:ABC-type sugar transport system ATPase subunit